MKVCVREGVKGMHSQSFWGPGIQIGYRVNTRGYLPEDTGGDILPVSGFPGAISYLRVRLQGRYLTRGTGIYPHPIAALVLGPAFLRDQPGVVLYISQINDTQI